MSQARTTINGSPLELDDLSDLEITQDILISESDYLDLHESRSYLYEFGHFSDDAEQAASSATLDDELVLAKEIPTKSTFQFLRPNATRTKGKHRLSAPPQALKGRAALLALASGAAITAATVSLDNDAPATSAAPVALISPVNGDTATNSGIAEKAAAPDNSDLSAGLAAGVALDKELQAKDDLLRRPLFASPLALGKYTFTSEYEMRWGTMHWGMDMAAPVGTPIYAATDGVVKEAGHSNGFGNWIQIKAADGTVTVYGHMFDDGVLVSQGQHVTAGDVIGAVGNNGQSYGAHLHFEVWRNGTTKIDPTYWLAQHGVRISGYTG